MAGIPTTVNLLSGQESINIIRRIMSGADATTKGIFIRAKSIVYAKNVGLIGADGTAVAQNQFGASAICTIDNVQRSGEVISLTFNALAASTSSATIIRQAFNVYMFDKDPSIVHGQAALSTPNGQNRIGQVNIAATDWDNAFGTTLGAGYKSVAVPFITNSTGQLFVAARHIGAQTWNSATTDDEQLKATFAFRLDD